MKAQDFRAWRLKMGFNRSQAAMALGLSRNQPQRWEDGDVDNIPDYIALACAALADGLAPWPIDRMRYFDNDRDNYNDALVVEIFPPNNAELAELSQYIWTDIDGIKHFIQLDPGPVAWILAQAKIASGRAGLPVRVIKPNEFDWKADWGVEPES